MKRMKRVFAMLLCVAMALSLCMVYAGATDAVYGPYDTLDDIPENVDVFRSIRTGQHPYVESGDYYEFHEAGFPYVRIKASAFTIQPTNAYLTADQNALSRDCKNEPSSKELWTGGASRVCYYKNMSVSSYDINPFENNGAMGKAHKYTVSMYRLELQANAYRELRDRNVYIQAKLTSGVTFVYDTGASRYSALHRQPDKNALKPSVSVKASYNYNPVIEYQIINGFGPYSDTSAEEVLQIISSGAGCVGSIIGLFGEGEKVTSALGAIENCPTCLAGIVKYSTDQGYHSDTIKTWDTPLVISPVELAHSDNFVVWRLKFRNDITYQDLKIEFNFV